MKKQTSPRRVPAYVPSSHRSAPSRELEPTELVRVTGGGEFVEKLIIVA